MSLTRPRPGRAVCALATTALLGCPDPPPPPSPPPPALPAPPVQAPPAPVTTADAPPPPTRVTVRPPPPPAVGERVRLGSGHLLAATPALRVGCAGAQDGLARLEVLMGPFGYAVEAAPGEAVAVGPASLVVDEVDPGDAERAGSAVVRWERLAPEDAPLELAPRERGDDLLVREMALSALADGARVGVGDVRGSPPRVTITVFPAGYRGDPGQACSRDLRVGEGALVGPPGGPRLRVRRITPRGPDQRWATVELGRGP